MNREVTLPLIVDDRGTLQVSAAEVSKLLRTVGGRWLHLVEAGEELDEDTVATLTIELAKLADRIDVACIAHSSGSASG
ncbi:DUF6213 family protein [Streptomyces brasiliscabiei]|uniref:DUF6213 family protein n=2 Tax=Streptomyces TaxID=1883 RepID=A0ABU8G9K2_9ACTN|nr:MULTISPECIES: DUF6213 family protein [Streptomyces]MBZ3902061.1 hypothetical protein [Streptomyces griseiscabiei]MDX2914389.1 DUF6213 family protein [Streptomyces griseiscabiei]